MAIVRNSIKSSSGGNDITVVANYSALPDPTTVSGKFYWCSSSQGTSWLPGSLGGTYYNSGMYYSNGTTWEYINVPYQATQEEVNTGTSTDKFVTPNTFANADIWENINTDAIDRISVKLTEGTSKGQAVYVSGADGTNILVTKASNDSESTSSKTIGLLESTGITNDQVKAITNGLLGGLNTNSATIGDPVWLGTSGNLLYGLSNKPFAPAHLVYIGVVTRVSATVGEIFIKVQNGFELGELHDVDTSKSKVTPVDADNLFLQDSTDSNIWKKLSYANLKATLKTFFDTIYANTSDLDLKADKELFLIQQSDRTLTSNTSAQNIFDVGISGSGAITLLANSTYHFELEMSMTNLSTTSGTISLSFDAGTANITLFKGTSLGKKATLNNASTPQFVFFESTAVLPVTSATNNATANVRVTGVLTCTTAGTILPRVTMSQASASSVKAGAYLKMKRLGSNTVTHYPV